MNKQQSGVLTIEAAIVLPLVIIAFVSVLFWVKVYYIQDQIHSALTKSAHDLSVDVYALDRLSYEDTDGDQVSLVDIQQNLYLEGAESMGSIQSAASGVADNAGQLMVSGENVVSFGYNLNEWIGEVNEVEWTDLSSILAVGESALELMEQSEIIAGEVGGSITGMYDALKLLYEEGRSGLGDIALMEAVDFSNGLVADKMAERMFHSYLSEDRLEEWGVYAGADTVDLSMSNMMLYDDTIELVAVYEIEIPFGQEWFGRNIPVFQKVRARAWTGSYDADELKNRPEPEADEEAEEIYYISNLDQSKSYHYYSCLRKNTVESTYEVEVEEKERSVCQYCAGHIDVEGSAMPVYYVSANSVIHYDAHCPKIWSADIRAVTLEEAIEAGHEDPCSKYNCVDDPRKRTE